MSKLKYFIGFSLLLSVWMVLAAQAAYAAQAGAVIFASGDAQIVGADGKSRNAAKGEIVNEGDTLVTGKVGAMQVRMSDEGFVSLRPDTRLTVQNFNWNGKEDGSERSVMSLVRGGFRTITGVIGKRNKDNYLVRTPIATIGIRGTDHEPHFIVPPAAGETAIAEPGAYNKVNVGATFIANEFGTVELGPNQTGFASATPGTPPQRLSTVPGFMRNAPAPIGPPDLRGIRDDDRDFTRRQLLFLSRVADWIDGDEQRERMIRMLLRYSVNVADGGGFDLATPTAGGLSVAPNGYAAVGGVQTGNVVRSGGTVVAAGIDSLVLLGPNNNPMFIADPSGFQYARGTAPLIDSGSGFAGATPINWGIYAGGTGFRPETGAFPVQYSHFMGTPNVTSIADLQVPGTTSFSTVVGFTKPINELGIVGGSASLSVTLLFGATPTITTYNLNVTDGSARVWNMTLNAPQSLLSFAKSPVGSNLSGSCSPCGAAVGSASGFVVGGAARNGLISSYDLKTTFASVTGSIAVK